MLGTSRLEDARDYVDENLMEGVHCPCCGQFCKIYKRKLNCTMSACIIGLVKTFERTEDWVYVGDIPLRGGNAKEAGGELAKLAHWGLIEEMPNEDETKRTSGFWRPTERGVEFVYCRISVPSHVYIYDNDPLRFTRKLVDIVATLGKKFNYRELMEAR
jgi:hypothetical protein